MKALKHNSLMMFSAVCATLLLSISCDKELSGPTITITSAENPERVIEHHTFTCTLGNPDTKLDVNADGKTTWVENDKILLHGRYIGTKDGKLHSTVITLTDADIIDEGKTAIVSFTTDTEGLVGIVPYSRDDYKSSIYAAYPAECVAATDSYYETFYHSIFIDTNKPLMVAYDNPEENTFVFKNVCAAISFTLPAENDYDYYVFSGNNGEIVGYDRFTVKTSLKSGTEGEGNYFPYTGGDVANPVLGPKTTISGPVIHDGTTLNTVYLPNNVAFTKGFKISFIKDGVPVKQVQNNKKFTATRNDYYALGDISSHLKDFSHTPSLEQSSGDEYDLFISNSNKTANSYIIYPTGNGNKVFRFKATEGNSSTSVDPFAVDVLWETYNDATSAGSINVIESVDYGKSGGDTYIYFKLPESPHAGNAVIAAKDFSGTILWSWHIWVPESTVLSNSNYGISTLNMMDRNLGAIRCGVANVEDIQAAGLLYQWGRKDPFPNKKAHTSGSNSFSSNHATVSSSSVSHTAESGTITLQQSIKRPTVFAAGPDSGNCNWLNESINTLWTSTKSKYDPCPPGYKVPVASESVLFTANVTDPENYPGWSYNFYLDAESKKVSYCSFTVGLSDNKTVFPTGMLYQNGNYDEPLNKALIWSATYESDNRAVGLYVKVTGEDYSQYKRSRANAGSIRCVVD